MAKPVDPSVVGTSTDSYATSYPFQRKSFYANGRFWVFYSDGANMVYRTSTDGSTWTSPTTVRQYVYYGYAFSVWFDGTYVHYAYASESSIYYRRGTPNSDGTITWSAPEQTVSTAYNCVLYPMVSVDSNGYVWIGYQDFDEETLNCLPFVIKSGNNDGTWGTGTITQLSTISHYSWVVSIIPLTAGKMLALYTYDSGPVKARVWTGSTWGTEVATTSAINYGYEHSAVAQGDDVHLVFLKSTGYDIAYVKYTYSTNSFGTETTLVTGATDASAPVISIDPSTNDLYVFAATKTTGTPSGWTANHIYYKKYTASTGQWGSWTDWIDETTEALTDSDRLTCFYKAYDSKIGLVYMTKTASPYNVKFAYLPLVVAVTVTVTDSVGLSDAALCNKAFALSDSASLSDAVLCHKTFAVSDSVGLADTPLKGWTPTVTDAVTLVETVLRNKAFSILDSIGLVDVVYRGKQLTLTDAVSLTDSILRNKQFAVQDALSLADTVLSHKQLQVSDTVSLADVALALKVLLLTDSISLTDAVSVYVGAILKVVEDSIGLSDAVYRNKSLIVSDTVSVLDQIFRNKPLVSISDVLTLAEVIAVSKVFAVADSVSLSDVAKVLKQLRVIDSSSLSDAVLCHKSLAVSDSVGLTETLVGLPSAYKIIADSIGLTDVVSVYVGAILKVVEDSIGLSDVVYRNKSLIISDTVSLVEQVLRHKPLLPVSDILTLAEVVAVSKVLAVVDSVSLSDVAKVLKQLRVSDSVTLTDTAQIPSKILKVLDSIGLSDVAKVDKALIVSDQIALVDAVYAGKVKRAKLFLVIGNMVMDLTTGEVNFAVG
jgi:hypothetical protein